MTSTCWLISVILLWGLLHSVLASIKSKSFVKSKLGGPIYRYYRILYNLVAITSFLPIMGLILLIPSKKLYEINMPWLVLTLFIQGIAIILIVIAAKQTGIANFFGMGSPGEKENTSQSDLKTSGLYKYVRHPIYTAGLFLMWSVPIVTVNYLSFAVFMSIYILIGASLEERKLLIEFGEDYCIYRQRVPMFFPAFWWNK